MSIIYLPIQAAYGQNVKPFDGALLYVYEVGTTTPKAVYSDKAETTPLTNPVVANGAGRFPAMYISGLYKLVLKDKNDVTYWTEDNLQGRSGDLIWGGNFDATTNAGDYPSSGSQGDWYVVSTGFALNSTSGSHYVNTRDFIICNKDGATGIDADWDIIRGVNSVKHVRSTSENLIMSNITNTTIDVDADIINIKGTGNEFTQLTSVDLTYSSATDAQGTLLASTWYRIWLDSAENRKLVPDLTGSADGTAAGFLVDSNNEFFSYGVKAGDIARDRTGGSQTTVSVTPTVDNANLAVTDDIFVNTDEYEIILQSPVGLGAFKTDIGKVYRSSGGTFNDSRKFGEARITTAFWHTVNGHGSSSTKIQKFTTEVDASDDVVVTVTNSATLGFTITANMDCEITVTYTANFDAIAFNGISKNSSELTTSIATITAADRMADSATQANLGGAVTWRGLIKKGDVIRPHTNGQADGSAPAQGNITVVATEII